MARPCGLLLPAIVLLSVLDSCAQPAPPHRPNVLLFVVDTLRADHVSSYGYSKETTPVLDALAREGILFEEVYAPAPQTAASHASLFTSLPPSAHRVWNGVPTRSGEVVHPRLADSAVTLAEVLRDAGYQTAAITGGGWVTRGRGLLQGFEHTDAATLGVVDRVGRALEWLEQTAGEEDPWFLFLHTYEVHTPYLPPAGYEDRFAGAYSGPLRQVLAGAREYQAIHGVEDPLNDLQSRFFKPALAGAGEDDLAFLRALYDAELSLVDEQLAILLAGLRRRELLEDTILIVTSDHGEEFREHGQLGHRQVYEECLHVPLVIRLPGGPRAVRRRDAMELVDLMPSLLEELGLEPPPGTCGRALGWRGPDRGRRAEDFLSEVNHPVHQVAWRSGSRRIVWKPGGESVPRAFDLEVDPAERRPLEPVPGLLERAKRSLRLQREEGAALCERFDLYPEVTREQEWSDRTRAELAQLGYVDG